MTNFRPLDLGPLASSLEDLDQLLVVLAKGFDAAQTILTEEDIYIEEDAGNVVISTLNTYLQENNKINLFSVHDDVYGLAQYRLGLNQQLQAMKAKWNQDTSMAVEEIFTFYRNLGLSDAHLYSLKDSSLDQMSGPNPTRFMDLLTCFVLVDIAKMQGIIPADLVEEVLKGLSQGELNIFYLDVINDNKRVRELLELDAGWTNHPVERAALAFYHHNNIIINTRILGSRKQSIDLRNIPLTSVLLHELVHYAIDRTDQKITLSEEETIAYSVGEAWAYYRGDRKCSSEQTCRERQEVNLREVVAGDQYRYTSLVRKLPRFFSKKEMQGIFFHIIQNARRSHLEPALAWSSFNHNSYYPKVRAEFKTAYHCELVRNDLIQMAHAVENYLNDSELYARGMGKTMSWLCQYHINMLDRLSKPRDVYQLILQPDALSLLALSKMSVSEVLGYGDNKVLSLYMQALLFVAWLKMEISPSEGSNYFSHTVVPAYLVLENERPR